MVAEAYENSRFQLKFKKPRNSKLGDFRPPRGDDGICCITLNGNLNPYQMLVTFVHEFAHYAVYMLAPKKYVEPHGDLWKLTFTQLLQPYLKPEIFPEDAKAGGAAVVSTGRSDYPNQVNNVLCFPGIFRGALDVRASDINDAMKLAAASAIAGLVSDEELNADYILPAAFDPRVKDAVAKAVMQAARESGVARV
jgi:hypothetical protein